MHYISLHIWILFWIKTLLGYFEFLVQKMDTLNEQLKYFFLFSYLQQSEIIAKQQQECSSG